MNTYAFQDPFVRERTCGFQVEAYYSRSWDHYDMDPHFHDRIEIMYVSKGSALVHLYRYRPDSGGRKILITAQRTERLTPGKCILLDQRVMHRLEVTDEAYLLNLEFALTENPDAFVGIDRLAASSKNLHDMMTSGRDVILGEDMTGRLLYAMEQTIRELAEGVPNERALLQVLMAEVLLRMAEASRDAVLRGSTLGYVRKAVSYLASHLDENIRVGDVAGEVGVAPAYLQRIFRQSTGMTVVDYLNKLRIQQSKQLLMFSDDSVMDVAVAVGFNSRQHFFRVFQAETGMSPREFRKSQRGTQAGEIFEFENVHDYWYDDELKQINRLEGPQSFT